MFIYSKSGTNAQIISDSEVMPSGCDVQMHDLRPTLQHVSQSDGGWIFSSSLGLGSITARQSELLAPTDYLYRRDRTSSTALDEWCAQVRQVNNDYEAGLLDYAGAMSALDGLLATRPSG